MRKLIVFAAVLLASATTAGAQGDHPGNEIFGGYSFLRSETGVDRDSQHGWGFNFAFNPSPRWGLVTDFSGHYGTTRALNTDFDISTLTFLFGPRASARGKSATAFGHVLLGGASSKIEGSSLGTRFAMALGGGVDIKLNRRFAFRPIQADYLPVRGNGEWLHNLRLQTGIVLKFGQ